MHCEIALCSKLNSIVVSIASPLLTQTPPSQRMLAHRHCKVIKEKLYMAILPAAVPILVSDVLCDELLITVFWHLVWIIEAQAYCSAHLHS